METRLISSRPVSSRDAMLLAALHGDSFATGQWTLMQMVDTLSQPTTRGWLAFDGDKAQAFILCQFLEDEAEILTFCTLPAARRKGIGKNLLSAAITAARAADIGCMFLEVAVDNDAALALYEQADFSPVGKRLNYYQRDGQPVDAVILEKRL